MEIELPQDFKELLRSLNSNKVNYLLIGGYAVIIHGYPRFTSDMDIVIGSDATNISRCITALNDFGFGQTSLGPELFSEPDSLVRMGVEPIKIEILNYLKGLDFAEAYDRRITFRIEDIEIAVISLADLITNKAAVGRLKDRLDVEELKDRNYLI
ncbi:MAG TPA: nucleotidyltransferase [Pyrinomonadaceae bacterium]|nr:nucleotidyltransferase [Pyrinomonadaceae bacterium]